LDDKTGRYAEIKRYEKGLLYSVSYSVEYAQEIEQAANLLLEASKLAYDKDFANYLSYHSEALLSDYLQQWDFAWLDMKKSKCEVVF
ncbi:Zn-dependent hydrolase, partial [Pseudoalteromonas sp. S4488]